MTRDSPDDSAHDSTDADDAQQLAEPKDSHPDSVARFYEKIHQRGAEDPLCHHTERVREHIGHLSDHVVPLDHAPPQIGVYKRDMRFYSDLLGGLRLEGYYVAEVEVLGNFLRLTVQPDEHRKSQSDILGRSPVEDAAADVPDARSPTDLDGDGGGC